MKPATSLPTVPLLLATLLSMLATGTAAAEQVATGDPAPGVVVEDILPAGLTLVSTTPSQGSCVEVPSKVVCHVGTLTAGSQATISLLLTVGSIDNTATVSTEAIDLVPANDETVKSVRFLPPTPVPAVTASVLALLAVAIGGIVIWRMRQRGASGGSRT